jgi:hypothetical protein
MRTRDSHGVSTRGQWGGFLQKRRRCYRANPSVGEGVLVLPRIVLPGSLPVQRVVAWTSAALALGLIMVASYLWERYSRCQRPWAITGGHSLRGNSDLGVLCIDPSSCRASCAVSSPPYCIVMLRPAGPKASFAPSSTADRVITTPFWLRSAMISAPAATANPASSAT